MRSRHQTFEKVKEAPKVTFAYNPHQPPVLRFDAGKKSDKLPELLQKAMQAPLTTERVI